MWKKNNDKKDKTPQTPKKKWGTEMVLIPNDSPVYEQLALELVIFILDASGSMAASAVTNGNKTKAQCLDEMVAKLIERLYQSQKRNRFKIGLMHFNSNIYPITQEGEKYFDVEDVVGRIPVSPVGGLTKVHLALEETDRIIDDFCDPDSKQHITIFLFTDGQFNGHPEANDRARELFANIETKYTNLNPTFATIGLGADADFDILAELASPVNARQADRLSSYSSHFPNTNKLCVMGHDNDQITDEKVEAIRNFLNVLTDTEVA